MLAIILALIKLYLFYNQELALLDRIYAIVVEDKKTINKGCVDALAKRITTERIYSYEAYSTAHEGITHLPLEEKDYLFVFLDNDLNSNVIDENGVTLYFEILTKFPNAHLVSISADPGLFEKQIREKNHEKLRPNRPVFDEIIEGKKVREAPLRLDNYCAPTKQAIQDYVTAVLQQAIGQTEISITEKSSERRATALIINTDSISSLINNPSTKYRKNDTDENDTAEEALVVAKTPKPCCVIS